VFEEQDVIEEAIFVRSDGRGVVEFILSIVAYDFADREWGGGTNQEVIVSEVAEVFDDFSMFVC
jgi:hypothetical protein